MSAPTKIEEGLKSAEIEITPEMIEVGARDLADLLEWAVDDFTRGIVSDLYERMSHAAPSRKSRPRSY